MCEYLCCVFWAFVPLWIAQIITGLVPSVKRCFIMYFFISPKLWRAVSGHGDEEQTNTYTNTGLKPKQKSEEYLKLIHKRTMIITEDETHNNLRNPQGHESPKHTA